MKMPKRLLVVLPVHNEEVDLPQNLPKVHDYLSRFCALDWSIIIAEQASSDKTIERGRELERTYSRVSLVTRDIKGRGGALKEVWGISDADYLAYMDIDLSSRLSDFSRLIAALDSGADIAIGSRLSQQSVVKERTFFREAASRTFNIFLKLLLGVTFLDAQCGFKIIRRDVFLTLKPYIKNSGWVFDTELLVLAEKVGYRIREIPIEWRDDPHTTVKIWRYAAEGLRESLRLFFLRPWRDIKIQG